MTVSTSACKFPERSPEHVPSQLVNSHIDCLFRCALALISYFMLVYRCLCDAQTVLSVPLINSHFLYITEQRPTHFQAVCQIPSYGVH